MGVADPRFTRGPYDITPGRLRLPNPGEPGYVPGSHGPLLDCVVAAGMDPRLRGQPVELRHMHLPSYWTTGSVGASVGASDPAWVSSETVMDFAKAFDSDLRNFNGEVDDNPNFGKRGYLQAPEDQKATHEAFGAALSALEYDWWGVSEGNESVWEEAIADGRKRAGALWKGDDGDVLEAIYKPEELGFYKRLRIRMGKTLTSIGAAELAAIRGYRARLKQIMTVYKALGYDLLTRLSPEPPVPKTGLDAAITAIEWVAGAVVVGGLGYMVWRFLPAKSAPHTTMLPPAPAMAGGMP